MKNIKYIILILIILGSGITNAQPNFLIILTDDQGWNALSTRMDPEIPESGSSYYHTPNLDKFAKEGMRFPWAYSAAPTCSPTRHSLQFGRTPASLQIWGADKIKACDAKDEESLVRVLKQNYPEYAAAHFGKWHIGPSPEALGFSTNDGNQGNLKSSDNPDMDPKYTYSLSEKAIGFMEEQKQKDKPFLLQVSYYANHLWFEAKKETIRKYTHTGRANKKTPYQNNPIWAAMNEDLDEGIGMVLNKLEELGLKENTYVIFTSDNGYEAKLDNGKAVEERGFYKAYPLRSHKYMVNEGGLRVPFIIRGPGIKANTISRESVATIDIYPTILGALDLSNKLPSRVEGGNLIPHIQSGGVEPINRKNPFLAFRYSKPGGAHDITVFDGNYKLLKNEDNGEIYLWDIKNDLGETKNLADEKPELTNKLHKQMNNYFENFKNNAE